MTPLEAIPIYGAIITTLTVVVGSIRWMLSSRINPLEKDLKELKEDLKEDQQRDINNIKEILSRLEKQDQEYSKSCSQCKKHFESEITEIKQNLVDDVKEISKGNFDFRLKYESSINEMRLLLAEKYASKAEMEKEIEELKSKIEQFSQIHFDLKSYLQRNDSIH